MTSAVNRVCVACGACEAEAFRLIPTGIKQPAEIAESGWINEPQQGLASIEGLSELISWQQLQVMQPLSQTKSQQSLTLSGMTSTLPAALKRSVINRFDAEMGGEILQTDVVKRVEARLLAPDCHQSPLPAP